MPYSAGHKADTRQRIIASAADLLRSEGIAGTGIAKVMKHAGLELLSNLVFGHFHQAAT
jgi:AcrR family transcriptional regulator